MDSITCLSRVRVSFRRLGTRKICKSYTLKGKKTEREIYHGSDEIWQPDTFYSTICFYYALLREEDGSGREAGGDG